MSNYNQLRLKYINGSQTAITLTSDTISAYEYEFQDISAVEVPEIVTGIGSYAFCDNSLTSITLNEGLQAIGNQAFQHGTYSTITIPSTVNYIGINAFNISFEQENELAGNLTVTCLATTPPELSDEEDITFGKSDMITAIYVPSGSVTAYQEAEVWSKYASKIQAMPPKQEWFTKGYIGDELVERLYLGSELVWSGGTEPVYSAMPLTLNITSSGTIMLSQTQTGCPDLDFTVWDGTNIEWVYVNSATSWTRNVNAGDKLEINLYITAAQTLAANTTAYTTFSGSTAGFTVEGNLLSLVTDYWKTATTLESAFTFYGLFRECTGLTDATNLVLPATSLTDYCYGNMFSGCTSLTGAPALPATSLAQSCYRNMFRACSSLATAPELPATTLGNWRMCYGYMFQGCTSLTEPPVLPATGLSDSCYTGMFIACSSLTEAPELPALAITRACYYQMFKDCTSIVSAVVFPNVCKRDTYFELPPWCDYECGDCQYSDASIPQRACGYMFQGCTSLESVGILTRGGMEPVTNNSYGGCYAMFSGCTSLKYIKCLATPYFYGSSTSIYSWASGVPTGSDGKFICREIDDSLWQQHRGVHGVPNNWMIIQEDV